MTLQNIDENFAKANEVSVVIQKKIKEYTANMLRLNESLIPWKSFFNSFQEKEPQKSVEPIPIKNTPEKNDKMQDDKINEEKENETVENSIDQTSFMNQTQNKTLTPPVLHTQNIITPSLENSRSITNSSIKQTPANVTESSPQYPSGLHMTFMENEDTTVIASKRSSVSSNLSTPPVAKRQEIVNETNESQTSINSSLSSSLLNSSETPLKSSKESDSPESPPTPELKYFKSH